MRDLLFTRRPGRRFELIRDISMKRSKRAVLAGLGTVLVLATVLRAETVADLVKQMPVQGVQTNTVAFEALLTLGAEGLAELAGMVRPPEVGNDAQARYLVGGMTFYAARPGADAARKLVERAWLSALAEAGDREIKAFFIRRLQQCGSPASLEALSACLADPTLAEPAAQALLAIDAPGTGASLQAALEASEGDLKTIVRALGRLEQGKAAKSIRISAASDDPAMQRVALDALAQIGPVKRLVGWNRQSFELLAGACRTSNRYDRAQALGRCLRYAERAADLGAGKHAAAATRSVITMSREAAETTMESAALALLARIDGKQGLAAVVESIHGDNRSLSIAGVKLLMRLGDDADARLATIITDAAPHVRVAALDVLEPGVSATVGQAVLATVSDTNNAVRSSAISAATRLRGREALSAILAALESTDDTVQAAIKDALLRVAMPEDMALIAAALQEVAPPARITLLTVLGERHAASQWDAVLAATTDDNAGVRRAACLALGTVGTTPRLPLLVDIHLTSDDARLRAAAAKAVVSVARAEPDTARQSEALLEAYSKGDAEDRIALLSLLAGIAGEAPLSQVVAASNDSDTGVRRAGIRALAKWPDDSAAEAMLAALVASQDLSEQVLLVRGLVRVVPKGERKSDAKIALYRDILAAAPRPDEKKLVLEVMAEVKSRATLDAAKPLLDDPDLQLVAARVVALSACPEHKYKGIKDPELRPALVKTAELLEDEKLRTKVRELLATLPVAPVEPEVSEAPIADGRQALAKGSTDITTAAFPPEESDFSSIFNGRDLAGWIGDTRGYIVEDGRIICRPGGNLYTEKQYSDFVLRFEFKLTAGANNGLGIRTPAEGNAAYAGMELQILDNTSPKYANLKPWQFHGSIYGLVPAERGHLKPVGDWNTQEVTAIGSRITVVLNSVTILDADLAALEQTGGMHAFEKHPGMHNTTGHVGFLGHGSVVEFRNLFIHEFQ